jgi:glyoxylase-like metal-dependent hydrolase (beta-lactamase superfamily II)
MMLRIAGLLDAAALVALQGALADPGLFVDGRASAGWHARAVKRNLQARRSGPVAGALRTIERALLASELFVAAARPKALLRLTISRYEPGMSYGSHVDDDGSEVSEGVVTASKRLLPQLAAAGYTPSDITYFALSHFHSDHTANANEFASATWIVQKAERDFMFADSPQGIIQPATYAALRDAETTILDNQDLDVFGDGSVVVMATPGHTPGHQVVAVKLANRGTVVLGGDLYHYPEERTTGRVPTFEFDAEQSRASRVRVEEYLKTANGELWIEHDIATHAALPKAPDFVD